MKRLTSFCKPFLMLLLFLKPLIGRADDLKIGDPAPLFSLKNQEGKDFILASRKDHGWTILYFYPKVETPGCTKQACSFRDSINQIRILGAELYGIG